MSDDRERWLQQRAYAIWETEGCPEGRDREHWEQAERELSAAPIAEQTTGTVAPVAESTGKRPRRNTSKAATSTTSSRRKKAPELRP